MKFFSRDYLNNAAANVRGFVLSDPLNDGPIEGYYWEVFHFTLWNSDSNQENMALYLFDALQLSSLLNAIQSGGAQGYIPDFSASTGGSSPMPAMHKLSAEQGLVGSAQWGFFQSQRGGGGTINHNGFLPLIYIPQRWGLYAVEVASTPSTNARQILMRLCHRQFNNGCSPDSGW